MTFSPPTVCPKCGHAESWSVFTGERGEAVGKCHRAKCGYVHTLDGIVLTSVRTKEPKHYTRPYVPLTDDQAGIISSRFGLPGDAVDGYSPHDDRFILGVTGPRHQLRGHIAYSLSGGKPKSLNYIAEPNEPWAHWALSLKPSAIVIVEDWFSAEKVREAGATGVAIMGTTLSQTTVTELSHVATNWKVSTYLALDRDAFAKSLALKAKYNEQFKYGLQVWALVKDLKYVTVETIKNAIQHREFDFSRSDREQGRV